MAGEGSDEGQNKVLTKFQQYKARCSLPAARCPGHGRWIVMYGPPEAMHRKPQLQLHRKQPEDSGRLLRKIMEHDGRAEKMTEERGR
jgi:hypothetical protein